MTTKAGKFSSRESEGRYLIDSPEAKCLMRIIAAVMTYNPRISKRGLYRAIDARVERAGGSLEVAAAAAEAEFKEKH
jgi:hypothetical protein